MVVSTYQLPDLNLDYFMSSSTGLLDDYLQHLKVTSAIFCHKVALDVLEKIMFRS